jgi:hypothetical protein
MTMCPNASGWSQRTCCSSLGLKNFINSLRLMLPLLSASRRSNRPMIVSGGMGLLVPSDVTTCGAKANKAQDNLILAMSMAMSMAPLPRILQGGRQRKQPALQQLSTNNDGDDNACRAVPATRDQRPQPATATTPWHYATIVSALAIRRPSDSPVQLTWLSSSARTVPSLSMSNVLKALRILSSETSDSTKKCLSARQTVANDAHRQTQHRSTTKS